MKPVCNFLHLTPWWAMLLGGLAVLVGLGLFATPFHVIELDKSGSTPAERRAIKSEINSAFSESAIDIAHGVVRNMRDRGSPLCPVSPRHTLGTAGCAGRVQHDRPRLGARSRRPI